MSSAGNLDVSVELLSGTEILKLLTSDPVVSAIFHIVSSLVLAIGAPVSVQALLPVLLPNQTKLISPLKLFVFPELLIAIVPNAIVTKPEVACDLDCFWFNAPRSSLQIIVTLL